MRYTLLNPNDAGWPAAVDALWAALGSPGEPTLFPPYFVKSAFVKLGGRLLAFQDEAGSLLGAGLLFPKAIVNGAPLYTLRLHALGPLPADSELIAACQELLAPARVALYRPADGQTFAPSHNDVHGFDVGAPEAGEMPAVDALQQTIWGGGPAEQYPDDMYSAEFGLGTALVARRDAELAGFLFGFVRFGELGGLEALGLPYNTGLSIESQRMGVAPAYRRYGLAATLKRAQARQANARGIDIIHWTADPLQYANAVLNFGKLRAVAGEFYGSYYPFQNKLNRVSASRLSITWLIASARGRAGLSEAPRVEQRDLARFPACVVLNHGPEQIAAPAGASHIAVEIPADWTALQGDDPTLAVRWRATTDAILAAQLGFSSGRYLVVDAAAEGERRFLVASQFELGVLAPS